jgi:Potato inhibitor I family
MPVRLLAVLAAASIVFAACGDDDDDDSSATTAAATGESESSLPVDESEIVGKSVDEATATLEAEGWTLRVVQRDGEDLPATADFLPNRVNVAVETAADGTETVTAIVNTG